MARRVPRKSLIATAIAVAFMLLPAPAARGEEAASPILVSYSFDDGDLATGPDTFRIYQQSQGKVRLSSGQEFEGPRLARLLEKMVLVSKILDRIEKKAMPRAVVERLLRAAVKDAEVFSDLLNLDRLVINEARRPRDDADARKARQNRDDVLSDAGSQIILRRVAAHVDERQHGQ